MAIDVGDVIGRYRIDSVLGVGGMGVVYHATDTVLDRRVALKVMSGAVSHDEGFRVRFQREAATLARLDSPHVIAIYDHGEHTDAHAGPDTPGSPYIVTQLVPGGELGQLIRDRGVLPPRLAAQVCAQIAAALADAHAAGVVHRDVKPANVLMRDADAAARGEPHVYLCDFGIAQTEGSSMTQAGGIAGTWGYLAPERGMGAPASPATDIYSVGCLLWACLTGTAPYRGSDVEVALAHQHAPVPQLLEDSETAAGINRVLARAMAKDPAQRYPTAEALRADLTALDRTGSSGIGVAADPTTLARPGGPGGTRTGATGTTGTTGTTGGGRNRLVLGGVAALALVLVLAGGAWAVLGGGGEPEVDPLTDGGSSETAGGAEDGPSGPTRNDFDGDGLGDLMVQTSSNNPDATRLRWLSEGTTFPDDPEEVPFEDPSESGVPVSGDFDGDGVADLVEYGAGGLIVVRYASGETTETEPGDLEGAFFGNAGDLDGDGLDDLTSTDFGDPGEEEVSRVFVSMATGDDEGLTVPEQAELPDDLADGRLEVGDVDGDGQAELVQIRGSDASVGAGEITILDYADGAFDYAARNLEITGLVQSDGLDIVQGDVDGDGAAELVFTDLGRSNRRIRVADFVERDGQLGLAQKKWFVGERSNDDDPDARPLRPVASDLNGDGAEDLVIFRRTPNGLSLDAYLSSGSSFSNAGSWADWDCDATCQDEFVTVDRNGL
ncbi:protein kinase [Nocardioides sp. CFH 31398]|uniref:protein kinase domain-containing protein n=1 Tax=Nocardioides sp. CFH 31398 TaxID=2919579 RepID=UPI001F054010|nr:protein kinase [Nocardioides sp. CFH 31398]MCH1865097.1 protein kinase [Nocardioides sp. CFH 31398]